MTSEPRAALERRVRALLDAPFESIDPREVEALALDLYDWQRANNPVLARIAEAQLEGRAPSSIDEIPAVPTDVFKAARVACFPGERAVRAFRTSGTTGEARGEHAFDDLSLYASACVATARRWLLPERSYRFVLLAATEREAPDSSLSFMLARFVDAWGGDEDAFVLRDGALAHDRVWSAFDEAASDDVPVALLGASYGFVHLADAMGDRRVTLPRGSVVMPTGGFKGRSREIEPDAFHAMLTERLGVQRTQVVGEYGMTELSSQAYEACAAAVAPGAFHAPPWMRVTAVDPVSLAPVADGEVGLLRVVDLANVGSAIAIQTADLGRVRGGLFEVLGRAPGATPRGCARALDAALRGDR